jgi:uncharacterized membrane protein YkvI
MIQMASPIARPLVRHPPRGPVEAQLPDGTGSLCGPHEIAPAIHRSLHRTATMSTKTIFQRYLLPGFVFQSVVIAGGYGTGRELVEFFLSYGALGGLLGMLFISTLIWSLVCAATFEFARRYRAFDYRAFFTRLLGRWWVLFEVFYVFMLMIVLAVIAAAAGSILQEMFNLPYAVGVLGIMATVGLLVFKGSDVIERFMAGWSLLLYVVYAVFCILAFRSFGDVISSTVASGSMGSGWAVGGVKYAAYNLGVIPAVLFTIRHHRSARDSLVAGMLAGPIAIIPGLLFLLAMLGQYPVVLDQAVPANYMLEVLGSRSFQIVFQLVLFGTLIETGTGMIHAINERVASVFADRGKTMPSIVRPAVALGLLATGTGLAQFGLINLIAKGYGTVTWGFLIVFVIPILAWGAWTLLHEGLLRRERRSGGRPALVDAPLRTEHPHR